MFFIQNILRQITGSELDETPTNETSAHQPIEEEKSKINQKIKEYVQQLEFQDMCDNYYKIHNEFRENLEKFKQLVVLAPSDENKKILEKFENRLKYYQEDKKGLKSQLRQFDPIYFRMIEEINERNEENIQRKKAFHEQKLEKWQKGILPIQKRIETSLEIIANLRQLIALDPSEQNKKLLNQNEGFLKTLEEGKTLREKNIVEYFPATALSDMTRCLMMDKFMLEETQFNGFSPIISASILQKTLKQLNENQSQWKIDQATAENLSECISHLDHLMATYLSLSDNEKEEKDFNIALVLKSLERLRTGQSVLLSLGCKKHGTLLCFTRNDFQFRLEHYNTGLGIKHHYQWEKSPLYQTCDVIDNVPVDSVLNQEMWQQISQLQKAENMDEAYEWIRSKMGKGGVHAPRSMHQEDYDEKQFAGSCSVQAFMALIRYKAMQHQPGSPRQKEAFYKLLKTHLFLQYLQDYKGQFNNIIIASHLPPVLAKLEGELVLIEISLDEKQSVMAIEKFKQIFHAIGEDQIFEKFCLSHQDGDFLNRYADFRVLSTLLFDILWKNPAKREYVDLQDSIFKLARAKLEKRLIVEKKPKYTQAT